MARIKDKQRAIELRKAGKSYSQIRQEIGVGKGTLSEWLADMPLSAKQMRGLRDWNQTRIEHYRATRLKKREARLHVVHEEQKGRIFPLSERDVFIAGLFLYWGEGSKTRVGDIRIANTDPSMPKFFVYWITHVLNLDKAKIRVHLHLYSDMDIAKEISFWSRALDIPKSQFIRPYIKKNASTIINRGTFGHGTCTIRVGNARVSEEVFAGIQTIRDYFGP